MNELWGGFLLGNASILTNVCLLPLYPGLIAFLAGTSRDDKARSVSGWLGLVVLAGVLTMMMGVGLILFLLQTSFGAVLPWLLPLIYALIIVLGLVMVAGYNPFNRLSSARAPVFKNPFVTAYSYGLMLGPMTLPCTGPIILSAFLLGAGSAAELANGLAYFLAFGLGFGWPLVVLPLFALPLQRRATGWLTQNYKLLTRVSGTLLLAIGLFGVVTELLPQYS